MSSRSGETPCWSKSRRGTRSRRNHLQWQRAANTVVVLGARGQSERDALPSHQDGASAQAAGDSDAEATEEEAIDPLRLQARELVKHYRKRPVVDGVSLNLEGGEVVGLLGPNGAGKTTTFYMLVGLVQPDAGTVWVGDQDVTALPMYRRARLGISYLPQEASVFRRLTVEDNLFGVLELLGVPWENADDPGSRAAGGVRSREAAQAARRDALGR